MDSGTQGLAQTVAERCGPSGSFRTAALVLCLIASSAVCLPQQKPSGPALSKGEIIQMLKGGMEQAQLGQLARQYGVSFEMTPETEKELRDAGANDPLINLVREVAPKPAAPSPPPAPAQAPVLVVESNPGGAQVYVDDEPVGKTSSEGRLKLSTLAVGEHRVRLSLAGYKDNEQKLQLGGGETVRMVVNLEAAPPPAQPQQFVATPPVVQPTPTRKEPKVVRYRVEHAHKAGSCHGWLVIGNGKIQYQAAEGDDSFAVALSEVQEAAKNPFFARGIKAFHIKIRHGDNYNFAFHRGGRWQDPGEIFEAIERAQAESESSEASSVEGSESSAKERARKEKRALVLGGKRSRK